MQHGRTPRSTRSASRDSYLTTGPAYGTAFPRGAQKTPRQESVWRRGMRPSGAEEPKPLPAGLPAHTGCEGRSSGRADAGCEGRSSGHADAETEATYPHLTTSGANHRS